jgi:hypothetical protein
VITGQTGDEPIFQGAADFDLELIDSRTLDGSIQELIYTPALHVRVRPSAATVKQPNSGSTLLPCRRWGTLGELAAISEEQQRPRVLPSQSTRQNGRAHNAKAEVRETVERVANVAAIS